MNKTFSPFMLGATLYMPATRDDLAEVILRGKIPELRSLVICLEDAVHETDLARALANLHQLLAEIEDRQATPLLVFVRPRHEQMATELVSRYSLQGIDGFVLPKFSFDNLSSWWRILAPTHLMMMPTLETREVYDVNEMSKLAVALEQHPCRERILALRIGGNDLMSLISLRHPKNLTLYDGPMGYVIKMLVSVFAPRGFALTAPVCEQIENTELLERELALDMAHGLAGKTVIHPSHLEYIHRALMVEQEEYEDALRILNSNQAVFRSQGAMCEPATHKSWATAILERAKHCGIARPFDNILYATRQ